MVVVGGWAILQDCKRGDWSISSTAVGRLKDALLKRLNLDRPDIAAAWIKPELPFLVDAIRHMLPFLNGTAVPKVHDGRRQHIEQGDVSSVGEGHGDDKHIEWARTNAAQCVALCWSMGAAVRIVETTAGVDLLDGVIDTMQQVIDSNSNPKLAATTGTTAATTSKIRSRFRGQCVGALAVLRISLSVEIKTDPKFQVVDTSGIRNALVQRCDNCLLGPRVQEEFPDVGAIVSTHVGGSGSAGGSSTYIRLLGWIVWCLLVVACLCSGATVAAAYIFKNSMAQQIVTAPYSSRYAAGIVSMLALVYMYGNAVFDWGSNSPGPIGEIGALTNFVLQSSGGAGKNVVKTKVS